MSDSDSDVNADPVYEEHEMDGGDEQVKGPSTSEFQPTPRRKN